MDELCAQLLGTYGISGLPVDVWDLARRMGVRVREREWTGLPHSVSVVECRMILLNARRNEASRRFDLAHELGHFVFSNGRYHDETENRFASCLLLPAREFRLECLANGGADGHLAKVFGVSVTAVKQRAAELSWHG